MDCLCRSGMSMRSGRGYIVCCLMVDFASGLQMRPGGRRDGSFMSRLTERPSLRLLRAPERAWPECGASMGRPSVLVRSLNDSRKSERTREDVPTIRYVSSGALEESRTRSKGAGDYSVSLSELLEQVG